MREVAAEFRKPVLLYSIGKDSSVMLHLARKAFFPGKPPFPLLHIDTRWKFREMIAFRDATARRLDLELIVHTNEDGVERGINPIASGSALHTAVMKTEALKQALDRYGFDAALGGARRDEEKSRAKERVFSLRGANHSWDPTQPAPGIMAALQHPSARARNDAGLSTVELDRTRHLGIYRRRGDPGRAALFCRDAAGRRARWRPGSWSMTTACRLRPGETPQQRLVRFRTLGCYPLDRARSSRLPQHRPRSSRNCATPGVPSVRVA